MSAYACCHEGCGHRICFDDAVERRLRQTGEWWVCPAGHQQHFDPKPTKDQKRIAELERLLQFAEEGADRAWEHYWEERRKGTDARRVARTCPICGTVFRTPRLMPEHLVDAHGAAMSTPLDVEAVVR